MNNSHSLYNYLLRLGDSSLIQGHRLSEWCGKGPILEEDIANTNMALDLIGQARAFLDYAAQVQGEGKTEDDLAYLRDAQEYRNYLLVEQPNGDFAANVVRQYLFASYSYFVFEQLLQSKDATIAGIAAKAIKEVAYHTRHTSEWMIRLGNGTTESHQRLQNALNDLWPYTGDLFAVDIHQQNLIAEGIAFDTQVIKNNWEPLVQALFTKANVVTTPDTFMFSGSLDGKHTEHLGYLLAEMQFLPRAYPGGEW